MASKRPRVIGLDELLQLDKPLRESPTPLVYFSDKEFARLIKGAVPLDRRPRGTPLVAFDPWPGGGVVQSKCESPPGQVCFGRWTPAGEGRGSGVYLGCVCKAIEGGEPPPPPPTPCQLVLRSDGGFACSGSCQGTQECRLGVWRDPKTRQFVLDCRCANIVFERSRR
jgi:hypothetical protein